jgi:hypothetical protein
VKDAVILAGQRVQNRRSSQCPLRVKLQVPQRDLHSGKLVGRKISDGAAPSLSR